jgi:hypothetical protein
MCQDLLRASHGMNFNDFFQLLKIVAERRINFLSSHASDNIAFDGWILGRQHAAFDLRQIRNQLEILNSFSEFHFLSKQIEHLLHEIVKVLDK